MAYPSRSLWRWSPVKLKVRLEALTPVALGDGSVQTPLDYGVVGDRLYHVSWARLIEHSDFNADVLRKAAERGQVRIDQLYPGLLPETSDYSLPLEPGARKVLQEGYPPIFSFARTAGRPFIPGSSVKGSFRTALLEAAAANDQSRQRVMGAFQESVTGSRPARAKLADRAGQRAYLGRTPNEDAFRALRVRDSQPFPPEFLQICEVRIVTLRMPHPASGRGSAYGYKRPGGPSADYPEEGMALVTEALAPGRAVSLEVIVDEEIVRFPARFRVAQTASDIPALESLLNARGRRLAEQESRFYRSIGLDGPARAMESVLGELSKGSACIPLGWGSGWAAKTATLLIDSRTLEAARRNYRMGRPGFPFPKTRKLVCRNGWPDAPLGWVKFVFEEA